MVYTEQVIHFSAIVTTNLTTDYIHIIIIASSYINFIVKDIKNLYMTSVMLKILGSVH